MSTVLGSNVFSPEELMFETLVWWYSKLTGPLKSGLGGRSLGHGGLEGMKVHAILVSCERIVINGKDWSISLSGFLSQHEIFLCLCSLHDRILARASLMTALYPWVSRTMSYRSLFLLLTVQPWAFCYSNRKWTHTTMLVNKIDQRWQTCDS